jgi:hypothetical protein
MVPPERDCGATFSAVGCLVDYLVPFDTEESRLRAMHRNAFLSMLVRALVDTVTAEIFGPSS